MRKEKLTSLLTAKLTSATVTPGGELPYKNDGGACQKFEKNL